jgi:hypothetical protein
MQDLMIAALMYGLALTVLFVCFPNTYAKPAFVVYFFSSASIGLWISLDILRRTESPVSGTDRVLYLLPILFVSLIVSPIAWIAWRACRQVLEAEALQRNGG